MFWSVSFLSHAATLALLGLDYEGVSRHRDLPARIQVWATVGSLALCSLSLAVLGWCVKKEYRYNDNRGRNYLPKGTHIGDILAPVLGDTGVEWLPGRLSTRSAGSSSSLAACFPQGRLPQLHANVKNISYDESGKLMCELYVYKEDELQNKLKKAYVDLLDLEAFIRIKYQKKYIDVGLMTVTSLPRGDRFNLQTINSKEAFKRAIDIFLACLLADSNTS